MTERVKIKKSEEWDAVPEDRTVVFTVRGTELGLVEYQDELYAVQTTCPHQGGPVHKGDTRGQLIADWPDIGKRVQEDIDKDSPTISCPYHGWEYDIESGQHLGDPCRSIKTYPVTEKDGTLFVDLET